MMKQYVLLNAKGEQVSHFRRDDETTMEEVEVDGKWVDSEDYVAEALTTGSPNLIEVTP